jgi:hypothetical protein
VGVYDRRSKKVVSVFCAFFGAPLYAALYQCSPILVVRNVGGNFGYVRGKGLKQKTL